MATLSEAKRENQILICDNCENEFYPSEIKLVDKIENMTIFNNCIVVDENDVIRCGTPNDSDHFISCPYCDKIHLFGFNTKE